jgi:MFS family permease
MIYRSEVNRTAVASLILGRVVYAVNWYSLAAVFTLTAAEFNENVSGLGLATATFYVGVGLFQVPGGILAARIGPRLTAICGTTIASSAALLSGFAGNLAEIVVLRFFVGLGMALVFAPCVILVTRFLRKGSEGLGVGLYNSAFYLGSAVGLSGLALLAGLSGWRISLITGGSLGLFTSILLLILVPKDSRRPEFRVNFSHLKLILLDKWLIALSLAMLGFQIGSTVVGNFMAYCLKNVNHLGVGEAGTIASLSGIFGLITAPFWGRVYDRSKNAKHLIFALGIPLALGLTVASFGTVYSAILATALVGLAAAAGLTFGFSAARQANRLDPECETLAVSWVNSITLFGVFTPLLLFSYLALQYGYSFAWLISGALAFVFTIPVLFSKASKLKREGER